jgi:hypothetical protein
MTWGLALFVLAIFDAQLSIAYGQSLISTNRNNLVTNWTQTSATNAIWYSIACSSDGAKLAAEFGRRKPRFNRTRPA